MLARIFDLFTQVDQSLDRAEGGLGIGLTLVRRLVELHDGTVDAFSQGPGQGSEFIVRLPVLRKPSVETENAALTKTTPSAQHRILIVDDNADAAESLAVLMRLDGHQTRTAGDGPTALQVANAFRPDVVLLDIGLPGMDGYEVARKLRENPADHLLVAAVTGYGQEEDRQRSREAGIDEHLTKPIDPDVLRRLLNGKPVIGGGK
jgi:CheY-like chemotaxis protein